MGLEIVDVKIVGFCKKHDSTKEYIRYKDEDIYCMICDFA